MANECGWAVLRTRTKYEVRFGADHITWPGGKEVEGERCDILIWEGNVRAINAYHLYPISLDAYATNDRSNCTPNRTASVGCVDKTCNPHCCR